MKTPPHERQPRAAVASSSVTAQRGHWSNESRKATGPWYDESAWGDPASNVGEEAARRDHRWWLWRPLRSARAREGAGHDHADRSPQSSLVPAAALSSRDGRAEPERHRVSDSRGAREAAECARAARGSKVDRRLGTHRHARRRPLAL